MGIFYCNMSNQFIITGLPRSRTAWLSALFCDRDVVCFHELINKFASLELMKEYIDSLHYKYVGISDSSIGIRKNFYIDNFKYVPFLIIKRDKDEVVKSFSKVSGLTQKQNAETINLIESGINEIKQNCDFLEVEYNDLNNEETLKLIFEYCAPEINFDRNKLSIFQNLSITQHRAKVLSEMDIETNILNNIN